MREFHSACFISCRHAPEMVLSLSRMSPGRFRELLEQERAVIRCQAVFKPGVEKFADVKYEDEKAVV